MNKKKGVYFGIAFVLVLGLFFIFLSFFGNKVITGHGVENPSYYTVTNCQELQDMKNDLSGNYELMNDIDCSETISWNIVLGFDPVGGDNVEEMFSGTLEGNNFTINGLYMKRSIDYVGLFGGITSSAIVRNVGLVDMNITGNNWFGGLVGFNYGGTILNSYSTGNLRGIDAGGCLVGFNYGGTISNSYSNCEVEGSLYIGGLAGQNSGDITNSYSKGAVKSAASYVGGLVGSNSGSISNSYGVGSLPINGVTKVGGFVGTAPGGIFDSNFWNFQSSRDYEDSGTAPFDLEDVFENTSEVLMTKSTFEEAGWDFCDEGGIWAIDEGLSYPCLNWEYPGCGCEVECECTGMSCESGNTGMICDGCSWVNVSLVPEVCGNGFDENCDGVDELCPELNLTNTFGNWTNFNLETINSTSFNFSSLPLNDSVVANSSNSVKIKISSDLALGSIDFLEIWEKDSFLDDLILVSNDSSFAGTGSGFTFPWIVTKEDLLNSGYEEGYEFYFNLIFDSGQSKSFEDKILVVNILGHPLFNSSFEWVNYNLSSLGDNLNLSFENLNSSFSNSQNTFKIKGDNLVAYENTTVAFEIYELDADHSDSIRVGNENLSGTILNGSLVVPWKISEEDVSNGGNEEEYEFYFKAIFEDGTFAIFDETLLQINVFGSPFIPDDCTEYWSCGIFSLCKDLEDLDDVEKGEILTQCYLGNIESDDCGYKTRVCSDLNYCETNLTKPLTMESCSISGTNGFVNPPANNTSKNKESSIGPNFWIYFVLGVILVLIAMVVIIIVLRKKGNFM